MRQFPLFFLGVFLCHAAVGGEPYRPPLDPPKKQQEINQRLDSFRSRLTPSQRVLLTHTEKNNKNNLMPSERKLYTDYQQLLTDRDHWQEVVALQRDLLSMVPEVDDQVQQESASMAEAVLSAAPELVKKYHVVRPALFQNFLINVGIRERGFCYHWAADLLKILQQLNPKKFQLHWGVAHDRKLTEHNCVVITAPSAAFETGLLLDGWRHAGKLYWTFVKKDHYPWKELPLSELAPDL